MIDMLDELYKQHVGINIKYLFMSFLVLLLVEKINLDNLVELYL